MKRPRLAAAAALAAVIAGSSIALWPRAAEPVSKPKLMVLTGLPILFGERFGLDGGSPTLSRLERDYEVAPIAVADSASLAGGSLLLMAQPRAQPAEVLVELDRWVRGGGRVLLLADPRLEWHSEKPLGDLTRPPPMFADTGLLGHWGLVLDAPERDGPRAIEVDGTTVEAGSPGTFRATPGGSCTISAGGFVARCAVGKGRAVVVADADFLKVEDDPERRANLDFLAGALESLIAR